MKRYNLIMPALLLLFTFISSTDGHAEISMPSIFGDNMVLQRNFEAPVWGKAETNELVTVSIDTFTVQATADAAGDWMVRLDPMKAGGPYVMTVAGADSLVFTNVMIGEVWVCSGQSNMQMIMKSVMDVDDDKSSANYPNIRMLTVSNVSTESPQSDFPGNAPSWMACSPDTIDTFSAVAFYFGRELHQNLRVPIGLIHSSWGGSVAEAWTSIETLQSTPDLRPLIEDIDSLTVNHERDKLILDEKWAAYRKAVQDSLPIPPMPMGLRGPGARDYPSGLFNAMLAPMIPYGIAGTIWYQGESNSVRAHQYRTLFPTMIRDWRNKWDQGDFPFIFVQIASWETDTIPVEGTWGSWPELREAQLMTLSLPNTGMAVTIDLGDKENIHPNNKWDVGHRLALNALSMVYGRKVVKSGPMYTSMFRDSNGIRLRFRHVANGLLAGNMGELSGFQIAGADRVFVDAKAIIAGNDVVVGSEKVPNPVAVRYAWDDFPENNLYNSAGLPASPFRTDDWPTVTEGILKPGQ